MSVRQSDISVSDSCHFHMWLCIRCVSDLLETDCGLNGQVPLTAALVRPNEYFAWRFCSSQTWRVVSYLICFWRHFPKTLEDVATVQSHCVFSKPVHLTFTGCRHACFWKQFLHDDIVVWLHMRLSSMRCSCSRQRTACLKCNVNSQTK